jgi:endonuclease YncB( thermonuclease family)
MSVLVERVIDGDTLLVASLGRVQLLGITAGKVDLRANMKPDWPREAQQRLEGLLSHRWVRLEYETDGSAGLPLRKAAYVFLEDGRFVNAWLVREGLARVSNRKLRRSAELLEAQQEARASGRRIWSHSR